MEILNYLLYSSVIILLVLVLEANFMPPMLELWVFMRPSRFWPPESVDGMNPLLRSSMNLDIMTEARLYRVVKTSAIKCKASWMGHTIESQ